MMTCDGRETRSSWYRTNTGRFPRPAWLVDERYLYGLGALDGTVDDFDHDRLGAADACRRTGHSAGQPARLQQPDAKADCDEHRGGDRQHRDRFNPMQAVVAPGAPAPRPPG